MKPTEAVRRAYERMNTETKQPVWISRVPEEQAMARAFALEEHPEAAGGPLYGKVFAVKDNIDVAGLPTTAGCPAFAYTPEQSAPVVGLLEAAGAILVGKTNMDQFATGLVGTRSPYGACPNATATAEPELDPPEMYSAFNTLEQAPYGDLVPTSPVAN